MNGNHQKRFLPVEETLINFGFSKSTYWFRFSIKEVTNNPIRWVLKIGYPHLDHIELYYQERSGDWKTIQVGDHYPFNDRLTNSIDFVIPLNQISLGGSDFYLKCQTESSVRLPLELIEADYFEFLNAQSNLIWGLFYGIILSMILYNGVLFIYLRDTNYLFYVLTVISSFLFLLGISGHGFQLLWPSSPEWNEIAIPFFIGILICFTSIFTHKFLNIRKNLPGISKYFYVFTGLSLAVCLASLFANNYGLMIRPAIGLLFVFASGILITGIFCWKKGEKYASIFVLSWSAYILFGCLESIKAFGIPSQIDNMIYVGSVAEVTLLSIALGYKYKLYYEETQRIKREQYKKEIDTKNKIMLAEQKALKSQMNPHFISNALNSIQNYYIKHDFEEANDFLTDFNSLLRNVLQISMQNWVALQVEIETLSLYLKLEQMRLRNGFDYNISVSDKIKVGHLGVPPMILQPYVENAIWHGISPLKNRRGLIAIDFHLNNGHLECIIQDNGIGIEHSKKSKLNARASKGMNITHERLHLYAIQGLLEKDNLTIEQLQENEKILGTKITIKIPHNNQSYETTNQNDHHR